MVTSNWEKFRLLMWKNWLLQWRHKIQMVVEILVPVLFSALLVLIRSLVDPEEIPNPTIFDPVSIDTLAPLRNAVANSTIPVIFEWLLVYSPKNEVLDQLMNTVTKSLQLQNSFGVDNEVELKNTLLSRSILAGVQFDHDQTITTLPEQLRYSLRFPGELRTGLNNPIIFNWRTNLLFPRFQTAGPRNHEGDDGGIPPGYRQEGFLAIQNAIASAYLKMQSGFDMPEISLQRYPYPSYTSDILLTGLETLVSMIIMLSFVYPCINTVKFIAAEKEKQLKETMKIMGLSNWLHWTGWFVRSMLYMTVSITFIVVLLKVSWYSNTNVSIFTFSDWSTLWVFLFVYSIATTMFCFMLSVFFARANTAAAVAGLVWFLFYAAYSFTIENYETLSLAEKLLLSLLSNTAMAFGFQTILRFEGTGEGLQWHNMWKAVSIDDNLSVGLIIMMLLVSSILYLLITLYVEQIFPGEYGVPEPWYFPFKKSFWCGSGAHIDVENSAHYNDNRENFEADPRGKHAGIRIQGLRKVFGKKVAVQKLSLNMFDDQITVLLGHNGAGKTTTMSMLTGMFPPSAGTATVNGKDIRTNIKGVRNSLGLCPQHNILFDELTVREHIVFYSRLKGLDNKAIEEEVTKYVKLIDLEPKINAPASTLSGGMKRKLSVCVAFCGGSKVVLCDEPTSGMDPAARRALWDVLQEEKKGRTVLLSTHFMDEADVLGDRIGIMSNGELKCSGSSYFLKKKFGVGYHLICVKKSHCDSTKITDLLRKYVPDVEIENDIGTELSYLLSDANSELFQKMFNELEQRIDELGVQSYGVSLTTLEEVFMKVGTDSVDEEDDKSMVLNGHTQHLINGNDDFGSDLTLNNAENIPLLSGFSLASNQIKAMYKKKLFQTMRSWILILIQILIPVIFIIITVLIEKARASFIDLRPLELELYRYDESVTVLEKLLNGDPNSLTSRITNEYENQFKHTEKRISLHVITENLGNYILKLSESILVRINSHYLVGATITNSVHITAWFNNQPYHTAPISVNLVHNAIVRAHLGAEHNIQVINAPMPYTTTTRMDMLQAGGSMGFQLAVNVGFAMAFVAAFYVIAYIKERECRSKLLQFVSGVNVLTFWVTSFLWDFFTYIVTVLFLIITFVAFQEQGWSSGIELGRIFFILMSFGFAVLPVTYIASMFFSVPASGFTRLTMLYIFTGMACFFIVFIMSLELYDLRHIAKGLTWGFLIFPHFALSHSLNNLNMVTTLNHLCTTKCEIIPGCTHELLCNLLPECCGTGYFDWAEPGVGRNLIYLYVIGISCFTLLLLIEYRIVSAVIYIVTNIFQRRYSSKSDTTVDSDVQEEKDKVLAMSTMEIESHNLVMREMTKIYGKFEAVTQLSVAVDQSECFGLLGVNGAGKTSTFKMLTGDEKISYGEAWVRGINLKTNMNKVHQNIGYCPQFDALIEDLTGRETLEIYCLLRGIPKGKVTSTSMSLAQDLNFIKHIDKKVKEYSGGNKRKLSTAVALVGNPAVVYLDEPTTGMDPGAKRQLWNMICKVRVSGKSIVLTSHSMDECEALCTRLAIMVNGEFKCIGSVQHLKNRFSKGFTLIIKIKKFTVKSAAVTANGLQDFPFEIPTDLNTTIEGIKEYVTNNFPGSFLKEEYQGLLTYYIPNSELKWSTMFGLMEEAKKKFNIEDYSLSQTTLEQVFLSFAKHQRDEKIDSKKNS